LIYCLIDRINDGRRKEVFEMVNNMSKSNDIINPPRVIIPLDVLRSCDKEEV